MMARLTLAILIAAASAAGEGGGTVGFTIEKTAMDFTMYSYSYGDEDEMADWLPYREMCFVRLSNEAKDRPLYITGRPRHGRILILFEMDEDLDIGEHDIDAAGDGVVDYHGYQAGSVGHADDYCGGELLAERPFVKFSVTTMEDWKQEVDALAEFLKYRKDVARKAEVGPAPRPELHCTMRGELSVGDASVLLKDLETRVVLSREVKVSWGNRTPYWMIQFSTETTVQGSELGLTGADAGEIAVRIVGGAVAVMPSQAEASKGTVEEVGEKIEQIERAIEKNADMGGGDELGEEDGE